HTDTSGREVTAHELWQIFADEYLPAAEVPGITQWGKYILEGTRAETRTAGNDSLEVDLRIAGEARTMNAEGSGPIAALVTILAQTGVEVAVRDYAEHALSSGDDAVAAAYVDCEIGGKHLW